MRAGKRSARDPRADGAFVFAAAEVIADDAALSALPAAVLSDIERPAAGLSLPLDGQGTAFACRVWQLPTAIKPGATATYGDVAGVSAASGPGWKPRRGWNGKPRELDFVERPRPGSGRFARRRPVTATSPACRA